MDRKELAKALKVLDTTPGEIRRQLERYKTTMGEIKQLERTGEWSPNNIAGRRANAKAERDKTCAALTKRMADAFAFVEQSNAYNESETIDFSDAKLNDAIRLCDLMGEDLSITDQANMLNRFAGNIGALRVLEKAFSKHGLALKDTAKELQKPIDGHAMEEMRTAISFATHYANTGVWEEDPFKRCMWTMGAFGKQIDRLALEDEAAGVTPYSAVLDALSEQIKAAKTETQLSDMTDGEKTSAQAKADAELLKLQLAQQELANAQANGKDPASVLNNALSGMERRGTMPSPGDDHDIAAAYKAAGVPYPKR